VDRFLRIEASSGLVLLAAAAAALWWANSAYSASYFALWHSQLGVHFGSHSFGRPLEWFINDGAMVVFFFVVGMEIRREVHAGELSEWRRALLPAVAAVGGMVVPALVYSLFAGKGETQSGWGVPMATDIAFAVGILALLGRRVPAALRVLLLALAVIDDLGAIIVIAVFYSSGVSLAGFGVAGLGLGLVLLMQKAGVRNKWLYVAPGVVTWAGTYAAGIHPTIAGVILGFVTPVRAWLGPEHLADELRGPLDELSGASSGSHSRLAAVMRKIREAERETMSPVDALLDRLHPWVAYFIMPLFALANAGVSLEGSSLHGAQGLAALGIAVGLFVGKPLGILLACFITLKLGWARLPLGLSARYLVLLGIVAGIGFTMALFVAQLAFPVGPLLGAAKVGVLCGSGAAGLVSVGLGFALLRPLADGVGAATAHDAETSTEF
jgi:NhaA family Na+:H+ antiporter